MTEAQPPLCHPGFNDPDCAVCRRTVNPKIAWLCEAAAFWDAVNHDGLKNHDNTHLIGMIMFCVYAHRLGCEPAKSRIFPLKPCR